MTIEWTRTVAPVKWEYLEVVVDWNAKIETILNNHGTTGWELVSVIKSEGQFIFYFKRPKN